MRISTIMAAYNTERYVAQALDSVLAQTLPSDEIIVVDDGSTDGTPEVLRTFATRLRIIRQHNCGPARALNVAIAASVGDALAFLDVDDLWLPNKLEIQSAVLSTEPELEAVFGYMRQFASTDLDAKAVERYIVPDRPQPGLNKNTLLIRRNAFERIGRFDEELKATDFVDWYARAKALGLRWRMLPEVVALRRHHPGNTGRLQRSKQQSEMLFALKRSLDMRRQT
jgi:glycosyltransferase involved in cell wall biosynthesis